jgi:diguanylate cyclase (GGDEF)-like protein/PAS domain S-box-containing protein
MCRWELVTDIGESPGHEGDVQHHDTDPGALLANLPDPVVVVSAEGRLVWANDTAESLFGWTREAAVGWDATELVHPDDLATALVSLGSVQEKHTGTLVEIRVRDRSGSYRRIEVRGRSAPDLGGVVLALRDVTERRRWELAGGDDAAAAAVFDALPTIALVLEPDGRIRSANRAFTRLLGHALESSLGRPLTDFVSVPKVLAVAEAVEEVAAGRARSTFETELVDADGTPHPMSITLVDLTSDEAVRGVVATATDVSALAEVRDRLAHAATHDSLTGLPNRLLLHERLGMALSTAAMRESSVGVAMVDVNELRLVNEAHGHLAGDMVLMEVAHRLADAVRDSDLVARFGGDEFVVVASGVGEPALSRLVDRINWLMRAPITLDLGDGARETEVRMAVTIGAVSARPESSIAEVLEQVDAALSEARSRRRQRYA